MQHCERSGGLAESLTSRARGGWGEAAIGRATRNRYSREQFARKVKTREKGNENVEFAIKFPGEENGTPVLLPIDAQFTTEDYHPPARPRRRKAI